MILRRSALSCVRTNYCRCRWISMSLPTANEERKNLPSRRLFDDLTERRFIDEQLSRSGRKPFEVMLEKPIVVKNFFISELESEEIKYPEVLSKQQLEKWKATNGNIAEQLTKNVKLSQQIESLKKMNLFGYNIPKEFGGQEYSYTERALASEVEAQNLAVGLLLNAHRLVCTAICENGTNDQCAKYLPKMATGEMIGTVAFQEWNNMERQGLNTKAEYDDDDEQWCLNGTKSFVINGDGANLFMVLAQTQISDRLGDKKNALSIFLVDSSLPGVKIHKQDKKIGLTDTNQNKVTFKDVIVSKDAILSIAGSGHHIEQRLTMYSRLNQGLINLMQMKSILQYMMDMAESIERELLNIVGANEAVTLRSVIGKYTCSIYALESMLYLTTGIMDKYDNTNIDLETAILKTYSQDQLLDMSIDLLNFVDSRVTLSEHPVNELIRNAIQLKFSESENRLKIHIGREGIHYRLARLIEEVQIKKNKEFVVKNFLSEQQLDMYAVEMRRAAKGVFDSIDLLRLGVSALIYSEARHEKKMRDSEIKKIADAAACIYASYACLLRGDRSLKLQLPNAQPESTIAQIVCDRNSAEVKRLTKYIEDGPIKTFESYHEYVVHLMLQPNNKFPAHPLTRFF
ncbi:complex I assembly factor ACAD9, mitochondrial-like [Sitodiplosis mosellana]|uniref:complex I assembly factor ACAD9, mitochondrial-like n=1 Tax=Sitodiplosis mosellana TaxID=263140 RepID=UPI002443FB09|nr:complex I assembly factor ACAD9, mitochondrial-like [Sitodiplosis mosellana]